LNVAFEATVSFIAEQLVQTILRFTHKTLNQPDVDQLKLPNFTAKNKQIDRVHKSTTTYRWSLST